MSIFVNGTSEMVPELRDLLIPSADMRAYVKKVQWEPTEQELAAMIFNAPMPLEEKAALLQQFANEARDSELRGQVFAFLDLYKEADRVFRSIEGMPHLFVLSAADDTEEEEDPIGYYTEWDKAYREGRALGIPFTIERVPLDRKLEPLEGYDPNCDVSAEETGGRIPGYIHEGYTADGVVSWAYGGSAMTRREHGATRFGEIYFPVPHPFSRGDIVRVCGTKDYIGVVRENLAQMQAFEEDWRNGEPPVEYSDYSDISVTTDMLVENGDFDHTHISPFELEYVDEERAPEITRDQWAILKTAQQLYRGEGSLETLALLQWPLRQVHGSPDVNPLRDFLWDIKE